MAATILKTLTLKLETVSYECQLTQAELVDEPTIETVETFCGKETSSIPAYKLTIGGLADWSAVNSVCGLIHTAYTTDPIGELDFVLTVGGKTRTGVCKPTKDIAFGGEAGSPLKFSVELEVVGTPTDGTVP